MTKKPHLTFDSVKNEYAGNRLGRLSSNLARVTLKLERVAEEGRLQPHQERSQPIC